MDQSSQHSHKTDFTPFTIGTVFNPIEINQEDVKKDLYTTVTIKYPSRLEAMAIDPSKIASNDNLRYSPGQIDFTVKLFKEVIIKKNGTENIHISERSKRKPLILHATKLMQAALKVYDGLDIDVDDPINLRHCGLGSSSGLIASIACAINELYGKPISDMRIVKYLAQNHGEEIDGDNEHINPVQCIGGSAACGTHNGGVVILAGENIVVKSSPIDDEYDVIIGVPKDFEYPDSKYLMDKEIENLDKFLECGKKYGPAIAYKLFHEALPALEEGNIRPLGDLIYKYRFNMGSIENCSFVYPPINEISKELSFLKTENHADVLSLSSVGPCMFVLTKEADFCEYAFKAVGMNTIRTKIHNGRYEIITLRK